MKCMQRRINSKAPIHYRGKVHSKSLSILNTYVVGVVQTFSGRRAFRLPAQKNQAFRAWVRFVQMKRQDYTSSSVSTNSVTGSVHFREEDFIEEDLMKIRWDFEKGRRSG